MVVAVVVVVGLTQTEHCCVSQRDEWSERAETVGVGGQWQWQSTSLARRDTVGETDGTLPIGSFALGSPARVCVRLRIS